MPKRRVVVIGGVAAGPKAAAKIVRLEPDAEVTVIEKGSFLAYAGCGLPYYVAGLVEERDQLVDTPFGVVRDVDFFRTVKDVRVLSRTLATAIDRAGRRVHIRDLASGEERALPYDQLVLATGASPVRPPLPGIDLGGVHTVHLVEDAERIRALVREGGARRAVIVGGGLIGVEMAESLVGVGCDVTMVEMLPQILSILDWDLARLTARHMESKGVRVLTGAKVTGLEGEGRVQAVLTDGGARLEADLVVLAIGVRPNVGLARDAGLELGPSGAIRVDDHLRTSDPDIYAAGDCAEVTHRLTGKPMHVPLGSTANKQGRVVAINVTGGDEVFPGVLGSTVCRVFEHNVARTGLGEQQAREAGFDVIAALAPGPDRPHYMPSACPLLLKLIVCRRTRRLLGAQATGPGDSSKRVDVAAMAIQAGLTVDDIAHADLTYAPPFSPAMDNLITAANVARNKLDGRMRGISSAELRARMDAGEPLFVLDPRLQGEFQKARIARATHIPLDALRGRLGEVPRDVPIVTYCKVSLRGYEAALILKAAGFDDVRVLDGGLAMWPYELEGPLEGEPAPAADLRQRGGDRHPWMGSERTVGGGDAGATGHQAPTASPGRSGRGPANPGKGG